MIRPLSDRVFVRPFEPEGKIGNIFVPQTAAESPMKGEVVAVGPGKLNDHGERIAMQVKRGDIVYYGFGGQEAKIEDGNVLVFRESGLLAIVDPD